MKRILLACGLAASVLAPSAAYASDWIIAAKVTMVESSYMPGSVALQVDTPAGNCAPGSYLLFAGQGPDATSQAISSEAAFVLLLTAKTTGQSVKLFGTNSGPNGVCNVSNVWLI